MITPEPSRTALVLIDFMPRIIGLELGPRPGAEALEAACGLAERFRAVGAPVVAVRVDRPKVAQQPAGSELHARVAALADEVVTKHTVGAFHETGLHELLRGLGVSTLVLAGIATNMGVESTARAASDLDYELVFAEDAMTALTAAEHEASVTLNLPRFGTVLSCAEIMPS
ncbi:isochorismatase family protein [Streptomyces sp. NPDC059989]|uniref:isochorismatase family protein n=1 Tax=Streptomyces sp. NPDC059989 TaxID=3347026 RepID=UPI0036BED529